VVFVHADRQDEESVDDECRAERLHREVVDPPQPPQAPDGGEEYERRARERELRNLERRAAKLGLTLSPSTTVAT
jgi:hypothetical protein